MSFRFELLARCTRSAARRGRFETPHGAVETPAFMPVGTLGSVKGMLPETLAQLGTRMLLANTYHLHLRPGEELVAQLGGLHRFMGWSGPILTDSGGYQVHSLGAGAIVREEGARMRSVVDGSWIELGPESAMRIQRALGADVAMAFDHCPSDPRAREAVEDASARSARWLERCVRVWREAGGTASGQALFGIVQGGIHADLRARSVEASLAHDLPGYAIGGVSVGESKDDMRSALELSAPLLPHDKPRYLMGVGTPEDFFDAVERGIDLFDCVTPTRHGRTHQAFTSTGKLNLRNACFARDERPLDEECDCSACRNFTRAYLRHLAHSGEMLAAVLLTLHNVRRFHLWMEQMRAAIEQERFPELRASVLGRLRAGAQSSLATADERAAELAADLDGPGESR